MTIYTINAKSYLLLDVAKKYSNLSFEDMGKEIISQYHLMIKELELKGIKYQDLKNMLIPQHDKKDICLVFDTSFIKEAWYGREIFHKYFPLLSKHSNHCVFEGDLIGSNENQIYIYNEMVNNMKITNPSTFKNSGLYYLVYINRLTNNKIDELVNGLKPHQEFIGYFDFTYSCLLKDYISNIIGQRYFIHKRNIVLASENFEYTEKNINTISYDFNKYGFQIKSISQMNYNIFLTYKIESKYHNNDISDQLFSLSVISNKVEPLRDLKLIIADEKLNYLLKDKKGSMKAGKLSNLDRSEIEKIIKNKIENNYIYSMEFNEEYNLLKFCINVEITNDDYIFKYIVVLKYLPEERELHLLTMY
jgi:hypothetical protein